MDYTATLTRPSTFARGATADQSGTLSHPMGEGWGEGRSVAPHCLLSICGLYSRSLAFIRG